MRLQLFFCWKLGADSGPLGVLEDGVQIPVTINLPGHTSSLSALYAALIWSFIWSKH